MEPRAAPVRSGEHAVLEGRAVFYASADAAPADEAALNRARADAAVEHHVLHRYIRLVGVADDAGDVRVAAYVRADGDVLYRERAALIEPFRLRSRHKSGGVVTGRRHGTRDLEVFDGRVVRNPEGSGENRIADVDVQRVSVAVECSDKGVVVAVGRRTRAVAERGRNADVFRQLEILSAVLRATAVDMLAERVPVVGGLNEIGLLFGAFALKQFYFPLRVKRQIIRQSHSGFVAVLRSVAVRPCVPADEGVALAGEGVLIQRYVRA